VAFKVDPNGRPVPKGPNDVANPYDNGRQAEQWQAFLEWIMQQGHRPTAE
jgi:hypothetical protein